MVRLVPPSVSSPGKQVSGTYYEVLDISPDEQEPKVIEEAALRCSGHVRAYQLTRESECTLRLNEIAQALMTLLDPVRRREYDLSLGMCLSPAVSKCMRPTRNENTRGLPIGDGGPCDVKLVYRRGVL
jgi:hypothetical protein